jgi:pimeloyl-ACP methyl ester carboxylesterase
MNADTIVLVHGLFMTPLSWEHWIDHYQRQGYRVLAPAWPGMDGDIEALRRDPAPIAKINAHAILDHYDRIIRNLENPPIIMGHSFGGAFAQVLIDRGLGAAGVVIDSAAVRGVLDLPISTLRSGWPLLRNPAQRRKAIALTPGQFHYAFTNTLSEQESRHVYDRYQVPGSRNILLEGASANFNPRTAFRVNFRNSERSPLLFIAGGRDHIIPASTNRANAAKYGKSRAITAFREFPDRSHYTLGQDGWEEVADYALGWAVEHAIPAVTNLTSIRASAADSWLVGDPATARREAGGGS